jgi:chromosome segregation ATPase
VNIVGKIFVFAVFIMSLVFMTFAIAIFASHTNWQAEAQSLQQSLDVEKTKRADLLETINELQAKVATSELERDQVVAKLQYALAEQSGELETLNREKDERETELQQAVAEMTTARTELEQATKSIDELRAKIRTQQVTVDEQIEKAVDISAKLHEKESMLAIVEERKTQLEKQLANARVLLKQGGLAIDSLPRDQVPTIDGVVMAVADGAVEVSLGGDDGLQLGHVIELYRDERYLGRAVVKAVKPDRAVAVLDKDFVRGAVQRGDRFTTRL